MGNISPIDQARAMLTPELDRSHPVDLQVTFGLRHDPLGRLARIGVYPSQRVQRPDPAPGFVMWPYAEVIRQLAEWREGHITGDNVPAAVCLYGPSGTGKTTLIEKFLWTLGEPEPRIVSCNDRMQPEDLLGGVGLHNGSTIAQPRNVSRAYLNGCIPVLDEVHKLDPGVAMCLQRLLDGRSALVDSLEIPRPPGVAIMATANTNLRGDPTGDHPSRAMDGAFVNRFLLVEIPHLPADAETEVVTRAIAQGAPGGTTDPATLAAYKTIGAKLVQMANLIRDARKGAGVLDFEVSTRELVQIGARVPKLRDVADRRGLSAVAIATWERLAGRLFAEERDALLVAFGFAFQLSQPSLRDMFSKLSGRNGDTALQTWQNHLKGTP